MRGYICNIYEPPRVEPSLVDRAERLVFVADGFSLWAALFPALWMIYHRLWKALAGFVIALLVLRVLAVLLGLSPISTFILMTCFSIGFGFVAADIRKYMLERGDYHMVGSVAGISLADCERRFFASWPPLLARLEREREMREKKRESGAREDSGA